jgi:hypothetical protein
MRLGLQLLPAVPRQTVKARLAVVLGCAPVGGDRTLLLQLQQHRIERALVDREEIRADLLDPPGNPVAMPTTISDQSSITDQVDELSTWRVPCAPFHLRLCL